jgi:hypothetical protein
LSTAPPAPTPRARAATRAFHRRLIGSQRLNVRLQNDALPAFLERIECKRDDLFNDVMDIRKTLLRGIADQLSERARRNETAISVYVIDKERVEDERTKEVREVPRPVETVWHSLAGLTAIRQQPLLGLGKRLADSSAALSDAIASPEQAIARAALELATRRRARFGRAVPRRGAAKSRRPSRPSPGRATRQLLSRSCRSRPKWNMSIRSPIAGLFCGTQGFCRLDTGSGRLSRLREEMGPSLQLASTNLSNET